MQLRHLEYFIQVAQCGSISKAAHTLYLKPSNLSKCISAIENEFDTLLFNRSSKGVMLTDDGEKVLAWAKELLEKQQVLKRYFALNKQMSAQNGGNITLGIPATINESIHAEVLSAMARKYPQMLLNVVEMNIGDIILSVKDASSDAAIIIMNDSTRQKIDNDDTLIFFASDKPRLTAYAAKDSPYAQRYRSLSLKTLITLPAVVYTPAANHTATISELLADYGALNIANQTSNAMLFHTMLSTGQYIAIGIEALSGMGNYTAIPIRDKLSLHAGLLINRNGLTNPLLRRFIMFYLNYQHIPLPDYLGQA